MKARAAPLLVLLVCGCRDRNVDRVTPPAPSPAPSIAAAATSTSGLLAHLTDPGMYEHAKGHPPACPDADFDTREHCVWLVPAGKTTARELAKKMTDAGFPAEAYEGERVVVWWTPAEIEAFFGRKPAYTLTGRGTGDGTVCVVRVPDEGRPPVALRVHVERWIVDDPVCELL